MNCEYPFDCKISDAGSCLARYVKMEALRAWRRITLRHVFYCPIYCIQLLHMFRYVFSHTRKFYENCKKITEKRDSIFNAMEKIQFLKKQTL